MAFGGTFLTQNKVLPGTYINFISKARALGSVGERGVVAFAWSGNWGKEGEVFSVTAEDFQKNSVNIFGYDYTSDQMILMREVFAGASEAKIYRVSSGTKAKADINGITATAICGGSRGNDFSVVIEESVDDENKFYVKTVIVDSGDVVDEQCVSNVSELCDNDFVSFSKTGTLKPSAGINLSGGTDTPPSGESYSGFLSAIEKENFTVIFYDGDDSATKGLFASFTKRLRDDEGYKITCVLYNYEADYEGVINVINECMSENSFVLPSSLVYWVAGMHAGTEINQSLTNTLYNGELLIGGKFSKSELTECVEKGKFVFYGDKDGYRILKDINSFVNFSQNKNSDFCFNQVIRILDSIANDTAKIFDKFYIGKCSNDDSGRNLFKTELIEYHQKLVAIGAIGNFSPEDITVEKGQEKGDVVVYEYVEPSAAMDKLYMTCVVE